MLVIRFFRVGKKNQPSFKIVVTDKRRPTRGGRFIEEVGFYNPLKKEKILRQDRVKYWLSVGAKPSPTVYNLLISEKIIEGKKIPVHKKAKKKAAPEGGEPRPESSGREEKPAPEKLAEETPKEKEEPKEEKKKEEKPVEEASKKEEAPKEEKKE